MNTVYRIVWNAATGKWVVASELAKGRGKQGKVRKSAAALALGSILLMPLVTYAANGQQLAIGEHLDVQAGAYQTSNYGQHVLWAVDGGSIDANGVDVAATGYSAHGVAAKGVGSYVGVANSAITTSGDLGWGVDLSFGASAELSQTSIQTSGSQAPGVNSSGGASLIADHLMIRTTGNYGSGVGALDGSTVNLTNVTVHTSGDNAYGLSAISGASVSMSNGDILTEGQNSRGIRVDSGAVIDLDQVNVTTTGDNSRGLVAGLGTYARSSLTGNQVNVLTTGRSAHGATVINADMTLTQSHIITSGANAVGVLAQTGGQMDLSDTTIETTGDNAHGVSADGSGAVVHMYDSTGTNTGNSSITTTGKFSNGVNATNGANVALDYTNITTSGVGSNGISGTGAGSTASMTGGTLLTTGASSVGVYAANGAQINITDSTVKTQGNSSDVVSVGSGSHVVLNNTHLIGMGGANGIRAAGAGSSAVMNGGAITSTLASVSVGTGASVELNGTAINNTRGQAVVAYGAGSNVTLNDVDIVQTGTGIASVRIGDGANLTMTGGSLYASGRGGDGISVMGGTATSPATTVDLTGTRIEIAADAEYALGVQVQGNAQVALNQASIITRGTGSYGIWQTDNASTTTMTDTAIHTYGTSAVGVVNYGGLISMDGGSVVTEGKSAHGLYASDNNGGLPGTHAVFNANNVNVITNGDAYGAVVRTGAEMAITGGTIQSNGNGVAAVLANGVGIDTTKLTLDGTQLVTTGTNTHGIYASNAAQVSASNVGIHTTGSDSYGVYAVNDPQVTLSGVAIQSDLGGGIAALANKDGINKTISVSNSTVAAQNGNAISSTGGSVDLNIDNSRFDGATLIHVADNVITNADGSTTKIAAGTTNISASNSYLNGTIGAVIDSGTLNLDLDRSTLNGDISVTDSAANANFSLNNASLFKGAANGVDQITIANGSQWTMTGDSTVGQLSLNDSVIAFAAPTVGDFKTLTVAGDFTSNGGTLLMNTVLGDDRSATDKLHVLGNTSGQANVAVNNVGGIGAQTVEGIQIIQVDGASNAQFNLSGRAVGGLYEYFLFQGGKADPNDGDWYLRSELPVVPPDPCEVDPNAPGCTPVIPPDPCEVDPNAPGCTPVIPPDPCEVDPNAPGCTPVIPPDPCEVDPNAPGCTPVIPPDPCEVDPNAPGCKPIDPPPAPVLRPEVGAYLANQAAAVGMFQHAMHDRLGEPSLAERLKNDDNLGSAWARMERNQADYGAVEGQIDVNSDSSLLQIGTDIAQWGQTSRGQIGIMAATGQANSTAVSKLTGYAAKGKVEGVALGVYGSWFANPAEATGAYVDTWVQAGRYKNSVQGEGLAKESYEAESLTGSVEAGYAWKVYADDAKAFYLEPQAQITYTDYRSDDHTEVNGTVVSVEEAGGLTTRLGLRAYGHATSAQGNRVQPFVTANWYHQSKDNAMGFDGEALMGGVPQDRYELKVGAQLQLGGGWTGWGHLGVQSGANDYRNVGGQLGLKYSW